MQDSKPFGIVLCSFCAACWLNLINCCCNHLSTKVQILQKSADRMLKVLKFMKYWRKGMLIRKNISTFTGRLTKAAFVAQVVYFIPTDFKNIILHVYELEEVKNEQVKKTMETLENELDNSPMIVKMIEYVGQCHWRVAVLKFALAELNRKQHKEKDADTLYKECIEHSKQMNYVTQLFFLTYTSFIYDERTATAVATMKWASEMQLIQMNALKRHPGAMQQHFLVDKEKEIKDIFDDLLKSSELSPKLKANFLMSACAVLAQRRSMSGEKDTTQADKVEANLQSLQYMGLAQKLYLEGKVSRELYHEKYLPDIEALSQVELMCYIKKGMQLMITNSVDNDRLATILYCWCVQSKNLNIDKKEQHEYASLANDVVKREGVRRNTKLNVQLWQYFVKMYTEDEILSNVCTDDFKQLADQVRDTSQHVDLSIFVALAYANTGDYEKALASYLYIDPTHTLDKSSIVDSIDVLHNKVSQPNIPLCYELFLRLGMASAAKDMKERLPQNKQYLLNDYANIPHTTTVKH